MLPPTRKVQGAKTASESQGATTKEKTSDMGIRTDATPGNTYARMLWNYMNELHQGSGKYKHMQQNSYDPQVNAVAQQPNWIDRKSSALGNPGSIEPATFDGLGMESITNAGNSEFVLNRQFRPIVDGAEYENISPMIGEYLQPKGVLRMATESSKNLTPLDASVQNHDFFPINYCNYSFYSDLHLSALKLVRMDHFIGNTSCSADFYRCSMGVTFRHQCSNPAEAFDIAILTCNYKYNIKQCPQYDPILNCEVKSSCKLNEFACCSDPQRCIAVAKRCDGRIDCTDGEDENNCPTCDYTQFACLLEGTCIPLDQRCNGVVDDCFDGSNFDEEFCDTCGFNKFPCYLSMKELRVHSVSCINATQRCDGRKNCLHGEDEMNCKRRNSKSLLCENQKQRVSITKWCDGHADCEDESDEMYCG